MNSVFEGNDDKSELAGNEERMHPTTLDIPIHTVRSVGAWHYFTARAVLLATSSINKYRAV